MRTLKKTLCLVLALVMVLGLCAFNVSAAEFTDAAAITYKEAVGVMKAAGVLDGFTDGSFRPDGTLTRAQAAKMIACMMDFGDLKGTSSFTDCKGHWADSYIAFCAQEGIIGGYGDGTFGPEDTLTGSAWAKMVICALGYNAKAEGLEGSGWEIAVAKMVKTLELAKNVASFDGTKAITREQACELGFQGMQADTVKYTQGITVNGVEIPGEYKNTSGKSLLTSLDITRVKKEDLAVADAADDFGRPNTAVWKKGTGENAKTVYTVSMAPIATMDGAAIDESKAAYLKGVDKLTVWTNGVEATDVALSTLKKAGKQVEFYDTDADKLADLAIVIEYKMATVTGINAKGTISLNVAGTPRTYEAPAEDAVDTNNYAALKGFAKGDILAVCLNGSKVMDAVKAGTATGKVTAADIGEKKTVTVGGTKYAVAVGVDAPTVGSDNITLYLSPNGKVIGFTGKAAEDTSTYAFVVKGYSSREYGSYSEYTDKYFVQAVDMNGQEVSYPVFDATYGEAVAGKLMKVSADTAEGHTGMYAFTSADTKDSDGNVIATIKSTKAAIVANDKRLKDNDGAITNDYFTSDVQFIYVSGTGSNLKITVKSGVQAVKDKDSKENDITKYYVAKTVGANKTVSVVFVDASYVTPPVLTSNVAFVSGDDVSTKAHALTDKDGKPVTAWAKTVYIDGEETTIYVAAKDALANGFYTVAKNGDLTELYDASGDNLVASTTVISVFGNWLTYSGAAQDDVTVASDVNIVNIAEIEDLTLAGLAGCKVALVLSADAQTITTIYVTAKA